MRLMPFKHSEEASIGVELEFQIINPKTYGLISRAKDIIRNLKQNEFKEQIKPEITQSMIEINSLKHMSPQKLYEELDILRKCLAKQAEQFGIKIAGGGTHPFQKWSLQKIFPTIRFKNISHQYRYLAKYTTIFGQHVHIGCNNPEDALYLTHALSRYVPQLITISASSPFYQGIDTHFQSSRSNNFGVFPTSGFIPYLTTWNEFSAYFYKLKRLNIIKSMKDIYWDVRPKPEFGTVEIRVFDTPLNIKQAYINAAYLQQLSLYLLQKRPFQPTHDLYYLYNFNRFQAIRYGFEGEFVDPISLKKTFIFNEILENLNILKNNFKSLHQAAWFIQLNEQILAKKNDAILLREVFKETESLSQVVAEQCKYWEKDYD
jgi:carboxylate-amine ligase